MNELTIQELSNSDLIRSRIFTIRGVQVMLDNVKCCQCDSIAVAAPCGGLRPIGRCACAEGVRLAETAGRAAKRAQGPTQTRRAKRVPSSQVQFSMKEVA